MILQVGHTLGCEPPPRIPVTSQIIIFKAGGSLHNLNLQLVLGGGALGKKHRKLQWKIDDAVGLKLLNQSFLPSIIQHKGM